MNHELMDNNGREERARRNITWIIDNMCHGSGQEFVKRTHISQPSVSHYVTGRNLPSAKKSVQIAQEFGLNPEWVMGYDVPMRKSEKPGFFQVSVLKKVESLEDLENEENVSEYLMASETKLDRNKSYFAYQIKGKEMEPELLEGDTVIVRLQDEVEPGDLVFSIDPKKVNMVRRFVSYSNSVILSATNPMVQPLIYTLEDFRNRKELLVLGKIVEIRREL